VNTAPPLPFPNFLQLEAVNNKSPIIRTAHIFLVFVLNIFFAYSVIPFSASGVLFSPSQPPQRGGVAGAPCPLGC
jgi:hypothetical protein